MQKKQRKAKKKKKKKKERKKWKRRKRTRLTRPTRDIFAGDSRPTKLTAYFADCPTLKHARPRSFHRSVAISRSAFAEKVFAFPRIRRSPLSRSSPTPFTANRHSKTGALEASIKLRLFNGVAGAKSSLKIYLNRPAINYQRPGSRSTVSSLIVPIRMDVFIIAVDCRRVYALFT